MTQLFWLVIGVLALWAGIVVMRRKRESVHGMPQARRGRGPGGHRMPDDDEIDYAALEAAEQEVRDLETDAKGRPLDEGVGDDWGPGTPKPPYA